VGGQPALAIGKPTLTAPTMHITIRAMYREPRDFLNGLILLPVALVVWLVWHYWFSRSPTPTFTRGIWRKLDGVTASRPTWIATGAR